MPKDLTDSSEFRTVTVPVGSDPATAASVEDPCQDLADRTRYLLDRLLVDRAGCWDDADVAGVTGSTWGGTSIPRAVCHDGSDHVFSAINSAGDIIITCDAGVGGSPLAAGGAGTDWRDEAGSLPSGFPWGGGGSYVDVEADGAGARVAVSDSAASQLAEAAAVDGGWTARSPATGAVLWGHVEYDPASGLWLIGGNGGEIESSPDRSAWTARTSGLSAQIVSMKANRDTSDPWILACTTTNLSRSQNGTSWSAAAHGLGGAIQALAYDAFLGRWVGIMWASGGTVYSDNQGQSWTAGGALPGAATPVGAQNVRIAADGQGTFVATIDMAPGAGAGIRQMFVTRDGGVTWRRVDHPERRVAAGAGTGRGPWSAGIAYGDGRFVTIGDEPAPGACGLFGHQVVE